VALSHVGDSESSASRIVVDRAVVHRGKGQVKMRGHFYLTRDGGQPVFMVNLTQELIFKFK
jgi:hypothetical protein